MVFCGQCGLHLPSNITRCPRCGAVADATSDADVDTFPTDAPTAESRMYAQHPQANAHPDALYPPIPAASAEQQKLVLHAGDYGRSFSADNEPTNVISAPDYRTRQNTPIDFQPNVSYTGYPIPTSTVHQNGSVSPRETVSPDYPLPPPKQQRKRRVVPLLVALFSLLIVLGAATFFAVNRFHLFSHVSGTKGGTTQNTPPVPTEQAKGVVQQYYTDVNNKNYEEAYSLWNWGANAPSLSTFKRGYANTEHDDLTINSATQLGDGTVRVVLTIVATERVNNGVQYHTYAGYYIVGQDGGTWKILRGILNRIK